MEQNQNVFEPDTVSVQIHLGIVQNVIQRMSANSANCKAWCITLVAAVLVIIADKGKPEYAWIALLPTLSFASLDAYYLALEKTFRDSYNDFILKLHSHQLNKEDLYVVMPNGSISRLQISALKSFSV